MYSPIHHAEYPGDRLERNQKIDGSKGILTDWMVILGVTASGTAELPQRQTLEHKTSLVKKWQIRRKVQGVEPELKLFHRLSERDYNRFATQYE